MKRFTPFALLMVTVALLCGFTYGYRNNPQTGKPDMVVTGATSTDVSGFVAGTDYLTPTGSAAALTSFPTLNQNTTGSAAKLTTPRTINGVSFDGTAPITITDVRVQSGTVTSGASDGIVDGVYYSHATVTFPVAFASTDYSLAGTTNYVGTWVSATASKTTTTCVVYITGMTAAGVGGKTIDWIGIQH